MEFGERKLVFEILEAIPAKINNLRK